MERRQLLKSMMSIGACSVLPSQSVMASSTQETNQAVNFKSLFNQSLQENPELIGFSDIEGNFKPEVLKLEGALPQDLVGTFYRNGPGKHERDDQRYQHLFEGDGMLQSFTIGDGKITHQGKFVNTPKFQKEQQAKKLLYSGPETLVKNSLAVTSMNSINAANTSVIPVGDDLWALWEAGSPTRVTSDTLEYKEQVTLGKGEKYGNSLQGLPFSAHPKIEANGDIWNFGAIPTGDVDLYHLATSGQVKNVQIVSAQYRGALLHDFLITEKHILLILPSLAIGPPEGNAQSNIFTRIKFVPEQSMRVLVISKSDLTIKKQYELPAGFVFHYGNAWEEKNGTIHLDASLYPNADLLQDLSDVMKGKALKGSLNAKIALITLGVDGKASQEIMDISSEFPKAASHLTGLKNEFLYHLSSKEGGLWMDSVAALNIATGKQDSYFFGEDYLVEEHIPVCPQNKEGTGYLIGTALHVPSKRTCLNIFRADDVSAGPVARAWLSHHLPLGFHGSFKAA